MKIEALESLNSKTMIEPEPTCAKIAEATGSIEKQKVPNDSGRHEII